MTHPILPPSPEAVQTTLKYAEHLANPGTSPHKDLFTARHGAASPGMRIMAPGREHEFLTLPHAATIILAAALATQLESSIPLADLQPFLAAIAAYAEFNGGCGHHPEDCPQEAEECKICAAFTTAQLAFFRKHPAAHFQA